jgi:hypothetical protein
MFTPLWLLEKYKDEMSDYYLAQNLLSYHLTDTSFMDTGMYNCLSNNPYAIDLIKEIRKQCIY